jgi:hypothetical protein
MSAEETMMDLPGLTTEVFDPNATEEKNVQPDEPSSPAAEDAAGDEEPVSEEAEVDQGQEGAGEVEASESEPDEPRIPATLLARAIKAGLEVDQVLSFESPKDLERTLNLMSSRAPAEREERTEQPPRVEQEEPAKWEDISSELEEKLDPDLFKTLQSLNSQARNSVQTMQQQMMQVLEMQRNQQTLLKEEQFEGGVNTLPEEWKDVLGKGDISDISEDQFGNRKKLFAALGKIESLDAEQGVRRGMNKRLQEALTLAFPDQVKSAARKELTFKLKSAPKVRKPAVAKKESMTGDEAALAFISQWQRDNAIEAKPDELIPFVS